MVQAPHIYDSPMDPGDTIIFFVYAALCFLLFISGALHNRRDVTGFLTAFVLCLALFYENLALAVHTVTRGEFAVGMLRLRGATQSFIIPLFLVTEFELNYEVHKRRSANFFGRCSR
jgi:hypothetical protein